MYFINKYAILNLQLVFLATDLIWRCVTPTIFVIIAAYFPSIETWGSVGDQGMEFHLIP